MGAFFFSSSSSYRMELPPKPSEDDCCNTGCVPCILDVYDEQIRKYDKQQECNFDWKNNYMSPTTYSVFTLIGITPHTKNTNFYTFEYIRPLRNEDVCIDEFRGKNTEFSNSLVSSDKSKLEHKDDKFKHKEDKLEQNDTKLEQKDTTLEQNDTKLGLKNTKLEQNGTELKHKGRKVFFKPGQHFLIRGEVPFNTEQFTRAYTPIPFDISKLVSKSLLEDKVKQDQLYENKLFTVLIKLYEGGVMSRFINKLKIGSETVWRGPYGDFPTSYNSKYILCIAQGIGITPLYAIINNLLLTEECESFIKLFYCCRADEVHLRQELYEFSSYWNFSYEIFLNGLEIEPRYREIIRYGKLGDEEIKEHLINKIGDVQVLICGSNIFMDDVKRKVVGLGVSEDNVITF